MFEETSAQTLTQWAENCIENAKQQMEINDFQNAKLSILCAISYLQDVKNDLIKKGV